MSNPFETPQEPIEQKDDKKEQLEDRFREVGGKIAPLFGKLGGQAMQSGWEKVEVECSLILTSGKTIDVDFSVTDSIQNIASAFENALRNSLADIGPEYDTVEKANLVMKDRGENGGSHDALSEQYER